MRQIIAIDEEKCTGCGQCVPACEEGAIQIIDGKARVVAEKYCDGLGACLGECPEGAITIVERLAEDFDPEAVEEYLKNRGTTGSEPETLACGCPSTLMQTRIPAPAAAKSSAAAPASALGHWPVQIRLVPPHAPFLDHADLVILADCAAVAYAGLHRDLLPDRIVLLGCPKFDDLPDYEERFTEIFKRHPVDRVTAVVMEVPCCSGLPVAVKNAVAAAGAKLAVEKLVIATDGTVRSRETI
jgi:Pyruvate/2-oxoacid:ferredoxin oxidoreductase delta subunit